MALINSVYNINHLDRIQRLATRLVAGIPRLPYEEAAASGPSFLAEATISGWSDYCLQEIHGSFGYWSELVFSPFHSTQPKRAVLQGTPRCEQPPKEKVDLFGEYCEILEKAPGFRCYSSFCQYFHEKVGESLNRRLFPSPLLTEHSSPKSPTPLRPACTPPASVYVTQLPVLSMRFLQASCGLLFAITNHNQTSFIPMWATHLYILYQVCGTHGCTVIFLVA